MAIMIPGVQALKDPDTSLGELQLYELLQKLPDTYYVFHSLSWNDQQWTEGRYRRGRIVEGESDFTVFHPEYGIIFFEVKDGLISCSREGGWVQTNRRTGEGKFIDPMAQARKSMHYFQKLLEDHFHGKSPCWVSSAVWFTSVDRNSVQGTLPANYPEGLVLWANDLESEVNAEKAIRKVFTCCGVHKREENPAITRKIVDTLAPEFNAFQSMRSRTMATKALFNQMTREQVYLLDYLEEQEEAAIHGVAGTGKTVLAVQKAQRLARKEHVLFLCFNRFLKDHLIRAYENPNIEFTNLDSLYMSKTRQKLPQDPAEKDEAILEFLMDWESYSFPYQHIIIDEGQDFRDDHLQALHEIAKVRKGCFYVFYDRNQFVQGLKFPEWLNSMECRLVLSRNCRNTKEIAVTSTRPIGIEKERIKMRREAPGDMMPLKPNLFFVKDKAQLKESLIKLFKKYTKAGIKKSNIAVLSCKSSGQSILDRGDYLLTPAYRLTPDWNNEDILFTTVRKFKGLEADVVICIDIDKETFETPGARNAFYVGTSRATTYLDLLTVASADELSLSLTERELHGPRAIHAVASALQVKIGSENDLIAE